MAFSKFPLHPPKKSRSVCRPLLTSNPTAKNLVSSSRSSSKTTITHYTQKNPTLLPTPLNPPLNLLLLALLSFFTPLNWVCSKTHKQKSQDSNTECTQPRNPSGLESASSTNFRFSISCDQTPRVPLVLLSQTQKSLLHQNTNYLTKTTQPKTDPSSLHNKTIKTTTTTTCMRSRYARKFYARIATVEHSELPSFTGACTSASRLVRATAHEKP